MGSALLDFALKQYEQATRLVSMDEAIERWMARQEGRIDKHSAPRRRSHSPDHQQDVNRRT